MKTKKNKKHYKVLIIGAGVAGLSAAKYLKENGLEDILVLEARNRIGGRVWTDRSTSSPIDLGAHWIHGPKGGNPITKLAKKAGAISYKTNNDLIKIYDMEGNVYSDAQLDEADYYFEFLIELVEKNARSKTSVKDILAEKEPFALEDPLTKYTLSAFLEFSLGGDIKDLSSKHFYDDEEFPGKDRLITNGYDTFSQYIAEGLPVLLEQQVQAIKYKKNPIKVETQADKFTADYVVITVPLGILKENSIRFKPKLPKRKQEAIDRLELGTVNKVILFFEEAFWETDLQYIGITPPEKGKYNYFLNYRTFSKTNALMTFAFGDFAIEMENHSDEKVIADIMAHLKIMYGENSPQPIKLIRTAWKKDKYTRGSYSFASVPSTSKDFDLLGQPVDDKLFFAGEHTIHDYRGTVHGAYMTGVRVGEEIIAVEQLKRNGSPAIV